MEASMEEAGAMEAGCSSREDAAVSLAAMTGLDLVMAANLLDAAGGDVEMAVALHFGDFGDQADEDLYEEGPPNERGSRATHQRIISRVEQTQKLAQRKPDVKKREKKSRAAVRSKEAEALLEGVAEDKSAVAAKSPFSCLESEGSAEDSDSEGDAESSSDGSSSEDEWVDDDWVPRTNECLFDGHESATFEANCAYMQKTHSFFVPFIKYLVDAEGLFAYLQEKMYRRNTCIYCNRSFVDLAAVRKHIKDKSHCKVNFEDDDGALELAEFYAFGKSWGIRSAFRRLALRDARAARAGPDGGGALVLPSGAKLGHRAQLQAYRKKTHHGLGLTVRENRSSSHRARPGGGGQVTNLHQFLQARIAARAQARENNAVLVRAAHVAGGTSKALAGQYIFKADAAYNKRAHAICHHWGAGGGGSHYHMAGSKQYNKGVRVKGVVMRHSKQGARLSATRQAKREKRKGG